MIGIGAADMFDLANANNGFAGFGARFGAGGYVREVGAEDVDRRVLDLFHAWETGPEGTPEHWFWRVTVGGGRWSMVGVSICLRCSPSVMA